DFDTIGTESVLADAEIAQVIHAALISAGVKDFTITLNDRRVLTGLLDSQGLASRSGPVLRAIDKLDKIGADGVREELKKSAEAGGAALHADEAEKIVELATRFRGGAEILDDALTTLGPHSLVEKGVSNLRMVLDLLGAAGVPSNQFRMNLGL